MSKKKGKMYLYNQIKTYFYDECDRYLISRKSKKNRKKENFLNKRKNKWQEIKPGKEKKKVEVGSKQQRKEENK